MDREALESLWYATRIARTEEQPVASRRGDVDGLFLTTFSRYERDQPPSWGIFATMLRAVVSSSSCNHGRRKACA